MRKENVKISMPKLIIKAIIRFVILVPLFSLLIFLPAGSLNFWNGWLFIGAFFLPILFCLIYFLVTDPEVMQKRMNLNEKENIQIIFNILSAITVVITFIFSGLDYRFHWSKIPFWFVIVVTVIMVLGLFMSFIVLAQNRYASRVIEIQNDQKLIDSGLYSIIRHPMYLSGIFAFCPIPLILGSFYAFVPLMIVFPILFVIRLINEEKIFKDSLPGYKKYMKKVKYRLIPLIW